ncbi:MAG: cytochrome-c peroxidase [Cyclobacteriaceae bacterium]|jgi:cytochrome c peroxidase
MKIAVGFLVLVTLCCSCDLTRTESQNELVLELPEMPLVYNVRGVSDHVPTLGRALFYDPRLSMNNSVSCASCHKQALAFSDNAALSRGFQNRLTERNSMAIQNIISSAFQETISPTDTIGADVGTYLPGVEVPPSFFVQATRLFWDGRESDLKIMVTRPIMNHVEMGIDDLDALAAKLATIPAYPPLFQKAFGTPEVNKDRIAAGLSAFLLSIRSTNSKFDFVASNRSQALNLPGSQLSAIEEHGRQLFFTKFNCNNCHEMNGFADIGLDQTPKDNGLFLTSADPAEMGLFKIPSLRNVQLTGPYMHDGRFRTLNEVMDHYSSGIKPSANLDSRLRDTSGAPKKMRMTDVEKKAIIAFLGTLTDYQLISDTRFSNPFRK